jgi:serine/threonine protein kinase
MVDSSTKIVKKLGDLMLTERLLGEGAFAQVFYGYYKTENDPVAIKIISKSMNMKDRNSLEREVKHLMNMKHENIVPLKGVCQSENNFYIAMQYCKKGTLKSYLNNKPKSLDMLYKITNSLFEGFKYLYDNCIIHRDIKLENILVDENEILKISDFGFSKTIDNMDLPSKHTRLGTPFYSCYEILQGEDFSSKCDVFSTGVILFEYYFNFHPYFPNKRPTSQFELLKALKETER